ncbi:MAG TPA: potassium-transporting ATPase subunit KdpA [Candidatus Bathyarchaeia archaeon]|nr:potassium-transporting ATPase subunit KdpA [Candidatus Bathyarchaeia archaeon]
MIDAIQALSVVLILLVIIIIARLIAPYITGVFTRARSRLDRVLNPLENSIYKLGGVDPEQSMGWKQYFLAGLLLNIAQMAIAYLILTFQGSLPLNPQGFPGLRWDLAFNTVISFATNTNLQHYNGETTLSVFSQMTAIQFLQFTSAATGICMGVAMVRGLIVGSKGLGNFYVDFVRSLTRILIPMCLIAALVLVWMGVPQTLNGVTAVTTVEGATQSILVGPVASLVSIMQLGTNGGGYYGANSAYPFQNPSPYSNILEMCLMLLLPTTLIFVFGELLGKKREARPILIGAYALFGIDLAIAFVPLIPSGAGIETRIGGFFSTFWTVVTTAVTTGSVNTSLSAMHPLAIVSALVGMMIQSTPGGKGVGLMYMIMYIVITVFIVGLMSGRTPEYLGIKITGRDVKLVMVAFLIHPLIILIPTVLAYATGAAAAIGVGTGSVGFTKVLYEFTSAAANNGSDFLGAAANTPFFNISTAIVIFIGRYGPIGILLALAGSMIGRNRVTTAGLKTDSVLFSVVLVGSIIILVVLTFFPFLALGPLLSFFRGKMNGFGQ